MATLNSLKIKIFADGADLQSMKALYANPIVKGFTTNPTLMKAAGVTDYVDFAKKVLAAIPDRPVSFEVFADEFDEMERQALEIASWGRNVNIKIPVTNTKGVFAGPLIERLAKRGVQLNVTAVFTLDQVRRITDALNPDVPAIVSIFAGRIADFGIDPVPLMAEAVRIVNVLAAQGGGPVGQPTGTPQRHPGGRSRLRHHHRDRRHHQKAVLDRQRPGRLLAGNRENVLQ